MKNFKVVSGGEVGMALLASSTHPITCPLSLPEHISTLNQFCLIYIHAGNNPESKIVGGDGE